MYIDLFNQLIQNLNLFRDEKVHFIRDSRNRHAIDNFL